MKTNIKTVQAADTAAVDSPSRTRGGWKKNSQATLNCRMIRSRSWAQTVNWAAWRRTPFYSLEGRVK